MTVTVFPEDGDSGTAANARLIFSCLSLAAWIHTGYTMSDGGGLVVSVSEGEAIREGELTHEESALTTTLADDDTNYVYLTHPIGGPTTITDNTTGNLPADSILIGTVVTASGSIVTISHEKNIENPRNVFIRKTVDQTVNNDATVNDDDDLQFAILAGQTWEFKIVLKLEVAADTSDFRYVTNQTVGRMITMGVERSDVGGAAPTSSILSVSTEGTMALSSAENPTAFIHGWFVAIADGDFKFQWSQATAQAHDTTILADSFLVARGILG